MEDFAKMVKERIEIEKNYGKTLQAHNQKWNIYADKIPNGTIKSCYNDVLEESKELARIHLAMKDRFNDEVSRNSVD